MGARGPPDIGGLISLKVDNFPFDMTCARPPATPVAPTHCLSPASSQSSAAAALTAVSTAQE